jgi:hypothetical protein
MGPRAAWAVLAPDASWVTNLRASWRPARTSGAPPPTFGGLRQPGCTDGPSHCTTHFAMSQPHGHSSFSERPRSCPRWLLALRFAGEGDWRWKWRGSVA